MTSKETLDALLEQNRKHDKAFGPGGNNHVPPVLIALYRMGGSSSQMRRYFDSVHDSLRATPIDVSGTDEVTLENWRSHLGHLDHFPRYVDFFDRWTKRTSVESVLEKSLSTLMKGSVGHAYHPLLRLGYAMDYDSREEIVFSLSYWSAAYFPSPEFDMQDPAVEPDDLLAELVSSTSAVPFEATGNIQARAGRWYASTGFSQLLKPVWFSDARPLERISELIMESFTRTQHFTLLHALTSCQALRLILPHVRELRKGLSEYWHSVCAAYLTVSRSTFEIGKDSVPGGNLEWKEILSRAVAAERASISETEHTIKLVYTCWLESRHYRRDRYLALASRELVRPSPFV